ncbi:MAG: alpha/beta hydrolase [Tannerella sp.]|jgi:acetyl esterase/lipase|nr:alpha/beta hydrolase [Tannerella sp.]
MNKAVIISAVVLSIMAFNVNAQKVVKLWDGDPPTSNGITEAENIDQSYWITNVSTPELTIWLPEKSKANGKAVVICPGGGYAGLASHHEGTQLAQWLNTQGIAGVVLKYRMPNKHKEVPLDDAQQAIRYVRSHAAELGVNPSSIGIAGSSAGGHLASTASTHFTTSGVSSRPDFAILFYPVITMDIATHGGSRANLLGDNPSQSDLYVFSNEKQVNNNTPPTLLLLSDDDTVVLPENSIRYYKALKDNGVKAAMYIFPVGGHGWGMREDFVYHRQVVELMAAWLKEL